MRRTDNAIMVSISPLAASRSRTPVAPRYTPGPSLDEVAAGADLSRGHSGPAVQAVQAALNRKNAQPPLAEDALFGGKTEAAVLAFQRQEHLEPTGRVDRATLDRLGLGANTGDDFGRSSAPAPSAPAHDAPAPEGSVPARDLIAADEARRARRSSAATGLASLPPRGAGAPTGSEFLARTRGLSRADREQAILREIESGNIPDFLRQTREVEVSAVGRDGRRHTGTIRVAPDYLAIGSNEDFVRIPMSPETAQRIADLTGTQLPTRRMVDEIYRQAEVQLRPQPLPAGPQMMSNDYYQRHQDRVERQRLDRGAELGALVAGNKKDIVATNALDRRPDRVAIYGWHQGDGRPIQPLSTVHERSYADYSHGARLISGTMIVDGVERPVAEVLADRNLAQLLSDEGAIGNPRVTR
ncbi:MAG: peptidoglycan-binding protein [Deltaproteobacteria bacterium]|nr:peptidoglycan-binding protein [Deltaproteobacteria bacterium]